MIMTYYCNINADKTLKHSNGHKSSVILLLITTAKYTKTLKHDNGHQFFVILPLTTNSNYSKPPKHSTPSPSSSTCHINISQYSKYKDTLLTIITFKQQNL